MLYVLLPAFDEEDSLPALLERFREYFSETRTEYTIVVVDDGSRDGTAGVVRDFGKTMPIQLVSHDRNRGLGAALRTGLVHLSQIGRPDDLILTMDADNTHDPRLVGKMMEASKAGVDIVIASRYVKGGKEVGLALHRRFLSRGASTVLALLLPVQGARDYTSGYRLYRAEVVKRGADIYGDSLITENSFVCMAEILVKLAELGARVGEVPMVLRYDLKQGASKMKKLRTILRYMAFITRERSRRRQAARQIHASR